MGHIKWGAAGFEWQVPHVSARCSGCTGDRSSADGRMAWIGPWQAAHDGASVSPFFLETPWLLSR